MTHWLSPLILIATLLAWSTAAAAQSQANPKGIDRDLSGSVSPDQLVRIAIDRNPGLKAGQVRAQAMRRMGEAERNLPPPEAELQLWGIPVSRPYDVRDGQMIMLTLKQPIPAPGSLGARAEVRDREADVENAMLGEKAREIARDVRHAFVDYLEATEKVRVHQEHKAAADRIAAAARARYAAGGPLTDITQAEVDAARIEADIALQQARIDAARSRINGLLLRDASAPLGPPQAVLARTVADTDAQLIAKAQTNRPEPKTVRARTAQRLAQVHASEREATWPMFSVGASYFAPTNQVPMHGFGVSVSSTLPWLWGRARAEEHAGKAMASASADEQRDVDSQLRADVGTNAALVRAGARRLQVLRDRVLPSAQRAWQAAASGYETGRTDIILLLTARKAIVEIEADMVDAHMAIEHSLVDLDWAAASSVRTIPIATAP